MNSHKEQAQIPLRCEGPCWRRSIDPDRVTQQDKLKRPIQLVESLHLTTGKSILDVSLLACFYFMEPLGGLLTARRITC
jgi:hypothetical protein